MGGRDTWLSLDWHRPVGMAQGRGQVRPRQAVGVHELGDCSHLLIALPGLSQCPGQGLGRMNLPGLV